MMPATLPKCTCGNQTDFITREFRRSTGRFLIRDGALTFRERHDTINFEFDVVLCAVCLEEVETEDFNIKV